MKTTLELSDELVADAERLAVNTGRSLAQVCEDSLRLLLSQRDRNGKRKRIRLPTSGGSGLLPGVDISSNEAMFDAMDEPNGYSGR